MRWLHYYKLSFPVSQIFENYNRKTRISNTIFKARGIAITIMVFWEGEKKYQSVIYLLHYTLMSKTSGFREKRKSLASKISSFPLKKNKIK